MTARSDKQAALRFCDSAEQRLLTAYLKVVEANYVKHSNRTTGVSAGTFVKGIDQIFSDYRFRRLSVGDIMSAVEASLSGVAETEVQEMLVSKLKEKADSRR